MVTHQVRDSRRIRLSEPGARLRLVVYLRVSTTDQLDGLGLDVQEKAIRGWAKRSGHRVIAVCIDAGVSGSKDAIDREGLTSALTAIQTGEADGLAIHRLDRLARSLTVQEAALSLVWREGCKVFTADAGEVPEDDPDDPMRTFVRQVMGAANQLEKAMIVKRMRDGRRLKGEQGGYAFGAPPLGKRAEEGELVIDDDEAATAQRIGDLRRAGMSYRQIVAVLDDEGHKTKRGGRWHPRTVSIVAARMESA
jgi:DNA invertase Pin-like site-specific DNA recombinase